MGRAFSCRRTKSLHLIWARSDMRAAQSRKSAKGHDWKRPDPARGSWDDLMVRTRVAWDHAKSQAIADYDWSARLEWIMTEDGNAIPF